MTKKTLQLRAVDIDLLQTAARECKLQALCNPQSMCRGSRIVQELRVLARTSDKRTAAVARNLISVVADTDLIEIGIVNED